MLSTNQEYQFDRRKIKQKKWSKLVIQEYKVYKTLIKHFGTDFKQIAQEMNRTFFERSYRPCYLERIYESVDPNNIQGDISPDEAQRILLLLVPMLRDKKQHIWKTIQRYMPNRSQGTVARKFEQMIYKLLRRFNFFYGNKETLYLYDRRVSCLLLSTINMIIYMGNVEPSVYDKDDTIVNDIWNASQRMYQLIRTFIDFKMVNFDEPMDYLDPKVMQKIPQISGDEFKEIMEPILLLESINRICFGFTPYRLSKKTQIEDKAMRIKEADGEYEEIPPILVNSAYGCIIFEKNKHNPYLKTQQNFYPRMSYQQLKMVQSSTTAAYIISLQTLLSNCLIQGAILI